MSVSVVDSVSVSLLIVAVGVVLLDQVLLLISRGGLLVEENSPELTRTVLVQKWEEE